MKIGRNDPCPCGSGKKYKHCCMSSGFFPDEHPLDEFMPSGEHFTGHDDADVLAAILRMAGYTDPGEIREIITGFHAANDALERQDKHPLTLMEYLNRPNAATRTISSLQAATEGHDFRSKAELDFFIKNFSSQRNSRPIADFLGLSPEQMQRLLYGRLADIGDIVTLNQELKDGDAIGTPLLEHVYYLLEQHASNNGRIRITAKGNYNTALVQAFNTRFFSGNSFLGTQTREDTSQPLRLAHAVLLCLEYVDEQGSASTINLHGMDVLDNRQPAKLYREILTLLIDEIDWVELFVREDFRFDALEFIQDAAVFIFMLLRENGRNFVNEIDFYRSFHTAFPDYFPGFKVIHDISNPDYFRNSLIPSNVRLMAIDRFCSSLGLVEYSSPGMPWGISFEENRFRHSSLFSRVFQWNV